ncbi:MAG: diacylglycerol kinase family protein [bacterium]|nr:diacylglycerol kinase family protein [bacterium]
MFAVIVNQEAKEYSDKLLERVLSYLKIHDKIFELFNYTSSHKSVEVFKSALNSDNSTMILMGGDRSLRLLIQTAIDSNIKKNIGLIPIDSTNKSSECLQISKDIEEACEMICIGFSLNISLGAVQLDNGEIYYFHHSANVGLKAEIIHQTASLKSNKITHKGFYTINSLRKTLLERPKKFDVHYSDQTLVGTGLIIGNGEILDKSSDLTIKRLLSSSLHSCLLTDNSKLPVAEFLLRDKLGDYSKMKQVELFESEEILIHKPNIPISVDGEYVGNTPAKFWRLSNAYPIITNDYKSELLKKY